MCVWEHGRCLECGCRYVVSLAFSMRYSELILEVALDPHFANYVLVERKVDRCPILYDESRS